MKQLSLKDKVALVTVAHAVSDARLWKHLPSGVHKLEQERNSQSRTASYKTMNKTKTKARPVKSLRTNGAKMAYEESPERRAVASDKLESTCQNRLNLTDTEMEIQEIEFNRGIKREEKNICRIINRGEGVQGV